MTDSVGGAPGPTGAMPTPVKPQPGRQVRQIYRVSAVRRPSTTTPATRDEPPPAASPVTDEELVYALVTRREHFNARLQSLADEQAGKGVVVAVELVDARPASSVLLELLYTVQVSRTASAAEVVANFTGAVIVAVAQQLQSALGAPVAVAATPDTAVAPATPATTAAVAAPSSTWDKLAPVLAAIGTGIGVIGFVTFIGGVVVWARLNGAGLPAAPALSVYPKQDLLVIGGQTLVPQLLVALAFVVVLSAFYLLVRLVVDRVGESEATLLAGQAPGLVALCMFVFVLIELGSTLIWYRSTLGGGEQALGVGLALGGAGVAALVGSVTHRYLYLAVTSFMILGVFMTFIAYWRARDDKQVRGAALIRDHKRAVTGIFLTEGSGRAYLALLTPSGDGVVKKESRIVGIDKAQVTDLAIAGAHPVREALADADGLARKLCALQPKLPAKQRIEDCVTGRRVPAPRPPAGGPKIKPYSGRPVPSALDREGAVLLVLPAMSEDATGVVSFVTRDRVWTTGEHGHRQHVQVALSTKPFRAQADRPIRLRLHLSRRALRAIEDAGGALPIRLRVVAVGSQGLAARDDHGCVVLRTSGPASTAPC